MKLSTLVGILTTAFIVVAGCGPGGRAVRQLKEKPDELQEWAVEEIEKSQEMAGKDDEAPALEPIIEPLEQPAEPEPREVEPEPAATETPVPAPTPTPVPTRTPRPEPVATQAPTPEPAQKFVYEGLKSCDSIYYSGGEVDATKHSESDGEAVIQIDANGNVQGKMGSVPLEGTAASVTGEDKWTSQGGTEYVETLQGKIAEDGMVFEGTTYYTAYQTDMSHLEYDISCTFSLTRQ